MQQLFGRRKGMVDRVLKADRTADSNDDSETNQMILAAKIKKPDEQTRL
jgi:hypothetical protein